jgi:ParB family chromosome partitioning protein
MIKTIPLNKLVHSPRNVRRHANLAADAELKASIAAHGLLQNLIVRPAAKGRFEVEAGERRRRAMLALVDDKILPRGHEVTCLVLENDDTAVETSLAENFHRLAMNPADEALAFASLVEGGASTEDVARRFGLTVRFVEGRLRLAQLAPVVFEALAAGEITLDLAKAFGATSDQEIQARVFEQALSGYYAPSPDSIRRMVLSGTVRGSDPRARLVGRDAYVTAGGRIERELFDDDDGESWVDVALLERLAQARMELQANAIAAEQGLAWVKPTLDPYASHDLVEGLVRLPAEPAPLTETELARLDELDAAWDEHAAIVEDEESAEDAVVAAEAAIEAIERECQDIRNRPPVLAPELKGEAGMILTLSREGTPVLQPVFYGERQVEGRDEDGAIEIVAGETGAGRRRAALSKRLVDELAMQRRDILALHIASDPGLALDLVVFVLADADTLDWRSRSSTTLRGGVPAGPIVGFEAKDAPASAALADLKSGLDERWRADEDVSTRFDRFRALSDEARAAWLGFVVARTLEALADVGGTELSSRFASVKKADLSASAERVFAGTYITEADVRERALAWVPDVMHFTAAPAVEADEDTSSDDDAEGATADSSSVEHEGTRELAA